MRSRGYTYTLNNYSQQELSELKAIDSRYHVIGEEKGESGTPFIQGYLYFKNVKSFSQLKKLIPRGYILAQSGSFVEAIGNCKKNCLLYETGEPPMSPKMKGQFNFVRWEDAWQKAKRGKFEEIDADIRLRYIDSLQKIHKDYSLYLN